MHLDQRRSTCLHCIFIADSVAVAVSVLLVCVVVAVTVILVILKRFVISVNLMFH